MKIRSLPEDFDKYLYYSKAVQSPETDVEFLADTYKELRGREAQVLREDFCGTFAISCEWVKRSTKAKSIGLDVDEEPLTYGMANYLPRLSPTQRERVKPIQADVLNPGLPKADVIAALNFSYYVFKERSMMKSYFHNCSSTLNPGGILVVDCFGGSQCQESNEEETAHKDFTYYWDQVNFDPISNEALFHIHFKPKGQKKIEKVFTYDWRMWTIPEIREMMRESGFKKTHVYWEGTTRSGTGDGVFKRAEKGEECQAWIAYVVGEK